MPTWKRKLNLVDIFHNDDMLLEQKRDEIVRRVKAAPFWDEEDIELVEIIEEFEDVDTVGYFDAVWSAFYDWADVHRIWVATF